MDLCEWLPVLVFVFLYMHYPPDFIPDFIQGCIDEHNTFNYCILYISNKSVFSVVALFSL